jgi:hypothetical protein
MRIAEGFESACAYRQLTGQEAGTCFGLRNFARFEPVLGAGALILLPDNDDEGQFFARQAVQERGPDGLPISIIPCPTGYGDWADLTRPHVHMSKAS